jgi:effector-binding domain-containing protein
LQDIERRRRPILPTTVVQEIPAVRVASRRSRVANLDDGVEELFEAVEADAARAAIRASGPPILLYHDRYHAATEADVEAAVPVVPHARQARGSKIRLLPAVPLAACVVYGGSYGQWSDVFRGLLAWLQSRRLAPSGPLREVYIQFGARNARSLALPRAYLADRAEDLVTEMQIPVRRGAPPGG